MYHHVPPTSSAFSMIVNETPISFNLAAIVRPENPAPIITVFHFSAPKRIKSCSQNYSHKNPFDFLYNNYINFQKHFYIPGIFGEKSTLNNLSFVKSMRQYKPKMILLTKNIGNE